MAQYQDISEQIEKLVGGRDNISHVTHCATRLRLVLKDNKKADMEGLENIRLVKGVFVAGDQLQMIFGAGLVNFQAILVLKVIVRLMMSLVRITRIFCNVL